MSAPLDPSRILQLGEGFMASKTLLSAVELELFTTLSNQSLTGAELATELSLHPRAIPDFPDTLLALGLLDRIGDGPRGALQQHRRDSGLPGQGQPALPGRGAGHVQHTALPVLGRSH